MSAIYQKLHHRDQNSSNYFFWSLAESKKVSGFTALVLNVYCDVNESAYLRTITFVITLERLVKTDF